MMLISSSRAASLCFLMGVVVGVATASTHHDPDRAIIPESKMAVPAYPDFRFTAWEDLSTTIRDHAHAAGYQGKTWNEPGLQEIEKLDWESLEEAVRAEMEGMGFTAPQWDCYMNHYRNYEWEDLEDDAANLHLQEPFKTLGWTHQSWDEDEKPDLEGKYWEDLAPNEKEAASTLCYTQTLWDEVAIPLWGQDDGVGSNDLGENSDTGDEAVEEKTDIYETIYDPNDRSTFDGPTGPGTAHNSRDIPIPMFRYDPWDELAPEIQQLAIKVKYNEKNWNSFSLKGLENKNFDIIGQKYPAVLQALKDMGFSANQWDCYISHYKSYEWDELKEEGVQKYFHALGWTHKMWAEGDKPDVADMYWPDLTEEQQDAAYELCYFRETWDDVGLQFWPRTTANTDWKAYATEYAKTHPAASGVATMVIVTILVGLIFCVGCCCRPRRIARGSSQKDHDLEMFGNDLDAYRDDEDPIDEDAQEKEEDDEEEYGEEPRIT